MKEEKEQDENEEIASVQINDIVISGKSLRACKTTAIDLLKNKNVQGYLNLIKAKRLAIISNMYG